MIMQKWKGYIMFAMLSAMLVMNSLSVRADSLCNKMEDGYTENGVYYEVYMMEELSDILAASGSVSVTREVLYYAAVFPSKEIEWTETISGVSYSGVLKLQYYSVDTFSQCTLAVYSGTLYATS